MTDRYNAAPLPPGLYEGGFRGKGTALAMAVAKMDLKPPLVGYYPGSSGDIGLASVEGVHMIHADNNLTPEMLDSFQSLGLEAYNVDVHAWHPSQQLDTVAFINSSGIRANTVLDQCNVREGGAVFWANWSGPPIDLYEDPRLQLVGVV